MAEPNTTANAKGGASKRNGSAAASKRNGSKQTPSAASRKASPAKTKTTAAKTRSSSKRSSAGGARAGSRNARTTRSASATTSRDLALERSQGEPQPAGSAVGNTVAAAARKAAKPVLAGGVTLASIAGAVAAGRALTPTGRRVLGVTVKPARLRAWAPKAGGGRGSLPKRPPSPSQLDMNLLATRIATAGQRVGRSGKQLSKIAADLQKAGEATEQVGSHLSK
jgi:hypothetical protein